MPKCRLITAEPVEDPRRSDARSVGAVAHVLRRERQGRRPVLDQLQRRGDELRCASPRRQPSIDQRDRTTIYDASGRNVGRSTTNR
jgi:hypothetical protein